MKPIRNYNIAICLSFALLTSCAGSENDVGNALTIVDSSDTFSSTFTCKTNAVEYSLSSSPSAAALFENSVVATDFDFITTQDSDQFQELKFIGRSAKEMPDRRTSALVDNTAFVFDAVFTDTSFEIWLHSDFENQQVARAIAQKLTGPLGRLPEFMRKGLHHVVVHSGDEVAFGEHIGNFFVVYSENIDKRLSTHDLEETIFHESVHATLDFACEQSDSSWNLARANDNTYITDYAAANPEKEDLAESALFAYTMIKYPGRLPENVESWIRVNLPNRLLFFKSIFRIN